MSGEEECVPSAFASHRATPQSYTPREDGDQEVPRIQTFREYLASLAIISDEQRLTFDPDQALDQPAERPISELAVKVGANLRKIGEIFDAWLFAPIQDLPFLPNQASLPCAD
jgi:hypothetical protein